MTFSELVNMGVTVFYIRSYGYQETGIFGGWQPFGNKARLVRFSLDSCHDLVNNTFMLEDDVESDDLFKEVNGEWVSVFALQAKAYGVIYYYGIDDFLESYHDVVYNCLNIK